ncbi:MAG: alpha-1,2-fucosyltransferase [Opitutaceae bacterium]|nr:alpha-1,2-fucosyltransferase [Opitutaceae bacterium]
MIITRLNGGLGNQMFQYAAGLALAEARRTVLKLDVSWFREDPTYEAHNRYALSCLNVTEQFATDEEIGRCRGTPFTRTERWLGKVAARLRLRQIAARYAETGHWHPAPTFRFYPEFHALPDFSFIEGTFQSEKFFAPIAPLVRLHFSLRYPAPPGVQAVADRIRSGGPSALVHFRRGDYARNPTFKDAIGVLGPGYYERALRHLRERHPDVTLYVFSDDIDTIAREFRTDLPHVFVREVAHWHSYDKIRLMSLCDHAIISNSTFAWWGAWLNPRPDRTVIAPEPWFVNSVHDTRDLVPERWTRLPGWIGQT